MMKTLDTRLSRNPVTRAAMAVLVTLAAAASLDAAEIRVNPPSGGVAIFVLPSEDSALEVLGAETAAVLREAFDRSGRFVPVEEHRLRWALGGARAERAGDAYEAAARRLDADLYLVIGLRRMGEAYRATMRSEPRREELAGLKRTAEFESRIMGNIPQKLALAAVMLHRDLPVRASVLAPLEDGCFILGAGQWHGLDKGRWPLRGHGELEVLSCGRYESVARATAGLPAAGSKITIPIHPDVRSLARLYEKRISDNTMARYGAGAALIRDSDPRKRYLEGACIVNPGGNACLPVYGAFLATGYLDSKTRRRTPKGLPFPGRSSPSSFRWCRLPRGFRRIFSHGSAMPTNPPRCRGCRSFCGPHPPLR